MFRSVLSSAIPLPIALGKAIGRNAALFLQQLHYKLGKEGQMIEGWLWFALSMEGWAQVLGAAWAQSSVS